MLSALPLRKRRPASAVNSGVGHNRAVVADRFRAELDSAMKRAISWCALFGGIASAFGVGIALMPLATGLFELDLSCFVTDARAAKAIQTQLRMADGLSMRMLATCAFALVLFVAVAYLDWQATKRSAPSK